MKTHDSLNLATMLRCAKAGDSFITSAGDKEMQSYAVREGCVITTRRLSLIDGDRIHPITQVTVTTQVAPHRRAILPRRPRINRV